VKRLTKRLLYISETQIYKQTEVTKHMEGSIRLLLNKENEAREKIEHAVLEKKSLKMKAYADAELAVEIIKSENEERLDKIRKETMKYIEDLSNNLMVELDDFERIVCSKDVNEITERLVEIITTNKCD